ncbi:MAG: hypothetical protein ABI867_22295 [Kofleriaceae bacterium]
MRWLVMFVAACSVGDDPYWDDARDDDGDLAFAGVKRVAIDPGRTDTAELVDALPVGHSEGGAERRVVMRVAVPDLRSGDRVIAPAEVQVTTRCDVGQTAPGCNYNPNVRAQLFLDDRPLSEARTLTCTHAEHHCRFVFRPGDAMRDVRDASASSHVELVMWAWHGDARDGDKVLVGSNDGDYLQNGKIEQDQGRLMVIRERGIVAGDRAQRETSASGSLAIPTTANPQLVYAHALKGGGDLLAGEQFVIEAKVVTAVSARARFSTELFVTKDRRAVDSRSFDAIAPGAIAEHTGINCTDTCTSDRVAVFRVTEDVRGPVYVNLVARSAVPGGGSARVEVRRGDGFVRSMRYAAAFTER